MWVTKLFSRLCHGRKKHDLLDVLDLKRKGAFKEAYDVLNEMEARFPIFSEQGDFQVLRAELEWFANDDASKAREALAKVRELGCRDWGSYYRIHGDLMWTEGNLEEAAQDYRQSAALAFSMTTLTQLAHVLALLEDKDVVRVCHEILDKDPDNCYGYIYLGWNADQSGNAEEATRLANRARELVHSADDFFEVGRLYHELGSIESALSMYLEADKLGHRHKGFLYACIGACYLSLDQLELAKRYINLASNADPDDEYIAEVLQAYSNRLGGGE
jgi:tetratricopeptide (TPR) repeat protein